MVVTHVMHVLGAEDILEGLLVELWWQEKVRVDWWLGCGWVGDKGLGGRWWVGNGLSFFLFLLLPGHIGHSPLPLHTLFQLKQTSHPQLPLAMRILYQFFVTQGFKGFLAIY